MGGHPLITTAVDEIVGRDVLHADKELELIAEVTGQPVERLPT